MGIKSLECEVDHTLPSSARCKMHGALSQWHLYLHCCDADAELTLALSYLGCHCKGSSYIFVSFISILLVTEM
jgi:hypothetical protein